MKIKLFYILHAGGFASSLNALLPHLDDNIELNVIEYAGRGMRSNEAYYKDFNEMVQDIYTKIMQQAQNDYFIIWGHSIGTIIAYEICHLLQDDGNRQLVYVILSGQDAPCCEAVRIQYNALSEDEREKKILEFEGIKKELEGNTKWLRFFMNYIEMDLFLLDKYQYKTRKKLNYRCLLLQGKKDDSIDLDKSQWDGLFMHEVKYMIFDGGHFFMYENILEVNDFINSFIKKNVLDIMVEEND